MLAPNISALFDEIEQTLWPEMAKSAPAQQEAPDKLSWQFERAKQCLTTLENDWSVVIERVTKNRLDRYLDIDVEMMRQDKKLLPDEGVIVRRVVDNNITREKAPYINFLTQPRRSVILKCTSDPSVITDTLESEYTRVTRGDYWQLPYFRCVDGAQLNGWSAIQTIFEPTSLSGFRRKYISTDRLMFPRQTAEFQQIKYFSIIVDISLSKLQSWVEELGFDEAQVQKLVQRQSQSEFDSDYIKEDIIQIRQLMYRADNGVIYQGWYDMYCDDWLKKPKPLYLGRQEKIIEPMESELGPLHFQPQGMPSVQPKLKPLPEYEYPIDILIYREDDSETILEHKGRAFLDKFVQIAQTQIWSGFVNKVVRSSNFYASKAKSDPANPSAPKLDKTVRLQNGGYYDQEITLWSFPEPTQVAIAASQALSSENAGDTQSTAFQVINRKDARKTKEELVQADDIEKQTDSVTLTLFSAFVSRTEKRGFNITQNRANNGKLPGFLTTPPTVTQTGENPTTPSRETRTYILAQTYDVRAAGDVDYIERKDKLKNMQAIWPIIASTGAASEFLGEILTLMFPNDGTRWKDLLARTAEQPAVIKSLVTVIQGIIKQYGAAFNPEELTGVDNILKQALAALGTPNQPANPQLQDSVK